MSGISSGENQKDSQENFLETSHNFHEHFSGDFLDLCRKIFIGLLGSYWFLIELGMSKPINFY